jgi:hypothetical protein
MFLTRWVNLNWNPTVDLDYFLVEVRNFITVKKRIVTMIFTIMSLIFPKTLIQLAANLMLFNHNKNADPEEKGLRLL